jgi:cytochrome c oxidase cbb3-type subunit 3
VFVSTAYARIEGGQGPATPDGDDAPAAGRQGGPGGGRGAGGRAGGGGGRATFPAQQRPPGDPVVITRGRALYGIHCQACHGVDLRGGDMGGPNLLRSSIALNDQQGELIGPIIRNGKSTEGVSAMLPIEIPVEDAAAIAIYIHSVAATMRGQGSPPAYETPPVLNVVVGDAARGQAYFARTCASCHSATGDLAGIGSRVTDPAALQTRWVSGRAGGGGRGGGGRGGGGAGDAEAPAAPTQPTTFGTVSVTPRGGAKVEGRLVRMDDFVVVLADADGLQRSFRRTTDTQVEVRDPLEAHRTLFPTYRDADMHDVTAYLVTLK